MIFTSPAADIPLPKIPYHQFLLEKMAGRGDKPALICGATGRSYSYQQVIDGIRAVAAGLHHRGFGKGDVFAIFSPNLPEYALIFNGVSAVGGINTTINPLYTAHELSIQLQNSGARFLITVPPFLEVAREAAAQSQVEEVFVFGEAEGATPFSDLLRPGEPLPAVEIDPDKDLVVLPYSSGTTGLPKGVMLSHSNLVANILQSCNAHKFSGIHPDEVLVGVLPFFHIYGMVVIMGMGLVEGATIITLPRFDMEHFLGVLEQYKVTMAHLVPPIVLGLAKHPAVDKHNLSSLKRIFSGAAPLGETVVKEVEARLPLLVLQGYGLTETSPVTHLSPDERALVRPASIGHTIPNTEIKVVDIQSGEALGPNREGEIWVRGPQVMQGYLNNPQATAECMDSEGFFHTGDIGYVDDDGYFYIVDRLKELIKYKGFQVAPAELEALLLSHPAILDVAVIPKPDEEAGEVPKAYVVCKPGQSATEAEIKAFLADKVAHYKQLGAVEFTDQIPKSPSGKILRRLLVDKERQQAG